MVGNPTTADIMRGKAPAGIGGGNIPSRLRQRDLIEALNTVGGGPSPLPVPREGRVRPLSANTSANTSLRRRPSGKRARSARKMRHSPMIADPTFDPTGALKRWGVPAPSNSFGVSDQYYNLLKKNHLVPKKEKKVMKGLPEDWNGSKKDGARWRLDAKPAPSIDHPPYQSYQSMSAISPLDHHHHGTGPLQKTKKRPGSGSSRGSEGG